MKIRSLKKPLDIELILSYGANGGNVAEELDENALSEIGEEVVRLYELDENSRSEWKKTVEHYVKLATQLIEEKNYPWEKASNVKFPLLTVSAIQFHARVQESLLSSQQLVKIRVLGRDPDGAKAAKADRVSRFLSIELSELMDDWYDEMDRGFLYLPFAGMFYKKSFLDSVSGKIISEMIGPFDLCFPYKGLKWERLRKTQILRKSHNELEEYIRTGLFLDVDYGIPNEEVEGSSSLNIRQGVVSLDGEDDDTPHTLLEQHTWVDLDGDGYEEPYIVIVEKDSRKVARIEPRFTEESIEYSADGEIARIEGREFYTRYIFIPDPDSPLYGIGLGHLLGSLNSSVNTVINQLIDAGTLANLGGGFLLRGVRNTRGGPIRMRPGEWISLQTIGDDIRKGIFPNPSKEPSTTLFHLLGLLVEAGNKVGSVADIMLGENPGQNQPYSTTQQVLEQGQKVFISIHRRIYRSMKREFKRIFDINRVFLDESIYKAVLDDPNASKMDFDVDGYDIAPAADPNMVSDLQRIKKNEALVAMAGQGLLPNPMEAVKRLVEAMGIEEIEPLMTAPPPQPNFEQQIKMKELEIKEKELQLKYGIEADKAQIEALKDFSQALKNVASAELQKQEADQVGAKEQLDFVAKLIDAYTRNREKDTTSSEG